MLHDIFKIITHRRFRALSHTPIWVIKTLNDPSAQHFETHVRPSRSKLPRQLAKTVIKRQINFQERGVPARRMHARTIMTEKATTHEAAI